MPVVPATTKRGKIRRPVPARTAGAQRPHRPAAPPDAGQVGPAAEAPPATRAQAPRAPGLDGVRALAVLAVIAFHENLSLLPGGFLGVDVFFVLSGFLITDLLAVQFGRQGRIDLRGFWIRRARRLLPALAVVLVAVTAAVAVLAPDQLGSLRPALLGAVTYTSNWWQALAHQSYFARFGPPPPLQHLWSLAVEEQFYLIWPLILAVVLARLPGRARAAVAWVAAACSALLMLAIYTPSDPSLVYYGTDTHATALLVGAALALSWPLARLAAAPAVVARRLDVLGLVSIAVLAWAAWHFSGSDPAVYPAGLVLAALAAGGLVVAAISPGAVSRALAWGPLRWLGIRSYGIYLWHWPVIALAAAVARTASDTTVPVRILETVLPIGLAAASWRWVEEPVLRRGLRVSLRAAQAKLAATVAAARRSPARALPLTIPLAVFTVACTAGYGILHSPAGSTLQQQIARAQQVTQTPPAAPRALTVPSGTTVPAPALMAGTAGSHRIRFSGSMMTAVGDSVMLAAAPELHAAMPGIYIDAEVSRQMSAGLQVVRQLAADHLLRPVVVVGLGTNGTVTPAQLRQLHALVGPDRRLVLVNVFVPLPWENQDNQSISWAARHYPNVSVVNWKSAIEHRTNLLWGDGVHPQPDGGALYARLVQAVARSAVSAGQPHAAPAARAAQIQVPGRRPL